MKLQIPFRLFSNRQYRIRSPQKFSRSRLPERVYTNCLTSCSLLPPPDGVSSNLLFLQGKSPDLLLLRGNSPELLTLIADAAAFALNIVVGLGAGAGPGTRGPLPMLQAGDGPVVTVVRQEHDLACACRHTVQPRAYDFQTTLHNFRTIHRHHHHNCIPRHTNIK